MEHAGATTGDWMTRLEAEERRCLWAPLAELLPPFLWYQHLAVPTPVWHRPFLRVFFLVDPAGRIPRCAGYLAGCPVKSQSEHL